MTTLLWLVLLTVQTFVGMLIAHGKHNKAAVLSALNGLLFASRIYWT
jgi:hypothetical protein